MVRISSSRCDIVADEGDLTILATITQIKKLRRALLGDAWIRISNGKILTSPAHIPPIPVKDEELEGYFPSEKTPKPKYKQTTLFPKSASCKDSASIYVQNITGYAPPGVYEERAKKLKAVGFECLRSQRGKEGKYWEIWYLPFPGCAKGEIKGKGVEEIESWLRHEIVPGTISLEGETCGLSAD